MHPFLRWQLAAQIQHQFSDQARRHAFARPADVQAHLTEQEQRVLLAVAAGASDAEIADRLQLRKSAVRTDLSRALAKLGLRDRVQAVIFAYEAGLVRPRRVGSVSQRPPP